MRWVPVWRRRLPFENKRSRLYIKPWWRNWWVVVGITIVAGLEWRGWHTYAISVHYLVFTPIVLVACLRVAWPGEWRRLVGVTEPGTEGPAGVTRLLEAIHDHLNPTHESKLRVTLFVPDVATGVLHQLARFSNEGKQVSGTQIRMGTGDVGMAFTTSYVIHIRDVRAHGGFANAMRRLGLETHEIRSHRDHRRRAFYAIPLVDMREKKRFGVLSLDSCAANFFASRKENLDGLALPLTLLRDQLNVVQTQTMDLPDNGGVPDEVSSEVISEPFLTRSGSTKLETSARANDEVALPAEPKEPDKTASEIATKKTSAVAANQFHGVASELYGKVDAAILTIRSDEHAAVLRRLSEERHVKGRRNYAVGSIHGTRGRIATVAVLRLTEPGTGPAQDAARDVIDDLSPDLICLSGIGGAVPASEFTLGDVILATRLADLRVQALRPDLPPQGELRGERVHKGLADLLVNLPRAAVAGWSDGDSIGLATPPVPLDEHRFDGPEKYQKKVRESLERHFSKAPDRHPIYWTGTVGSSDALVRDPEIIAHWGEVSRKIEVYEMEAAGVFEAAARPDRTYPVLVVRGVSDIVGYQREPEWTAYACETAAAFLVALVQSGLLETLRPQA